LLQTVEGLVEFANMSRKSRINDQQSQWAESSILFLTVFREERRSSRQLMYQPVLGVSQGEDCVNRSGLDNRAESFIIINPGSLSEPTKYPTSLISVQRPICMKFVLENPLSGDNIGLGRTRNEIPVMII
jgi:hypothetical protein